MIEKINISEKYFLYKMKYNGSFSKTDFLKRVNQNKSLFVNEIDKKSNSLLIQFECDEFTNLDSLVLNAISNLFSIDTTYFAKSSWIYTQTKDFKMNWMHTHEYLHSSNYTNLKTQFTFVFYIQIPIDMKEGEGDIIFKTEDSKLHRITPSEFDIFIFSGDLPHMAVPTQSSDENRIVYATNVCFDFQQRNSNKRVQFKNVIYKKQIMNK
jgi:hypothetical protein